MADIMETKSTVRTLCRPPRMYRLPTVTVHGQANGQTRHPSQTIDSMGKRDTHPRSQQSKKMIKSPFTKLLTFLLAFSLLNSSLVYGIISPPLSKSGTSTLGANHSGHNRKQTTLASIGSGNIQIGGKKQSDAELKKQGLNTDITQTQKLTKNQQTGEN